MVESGFRQYRAAGVPGAEKENVHTFALVFRYLQQRIFCGSIALLRVQHSA